MVAVRCKVKPQPILATDDRGWQIHSSQPEKKQDSQFIKQTDVDNQMYNQLNKNFITRLHELNKNEHGFGHVWVAKNK